MDTQRKDVCKKEKVKAPGKEKGKMERDPSAVTAEKQTTLRPHAMRHLVAQQETLKAGDVAKEKRARDLLRHLPSQSHASFG